jgi:exoribonuclease-2
MHFRVSCMSISRSGTGFPGIDARNCPAICRAPMSPPSRSTTPQPPRSTMRFFGRQTLPGIGWRVGIHIAAPGLAIEHGSPLDGVARARLSTVYMPGNKITMLPDAVVQNYTLAGGAIARRCRCI